MGLTWLFIATAGPLAAVMPPLNFVLVPLVLFIASSLVGFLSEKTSREACCPACGRALPTSSGDAAALLSGRPPGPADERLVERTLV